MDTVPLLPVNCLSLPASLPQMVEVAGRWLLGGLRLMNGASCLSDPLHFIQARLRGLQVVAEGAAEPELMTELCSAVGLPSG